MDERKEAWLAWYNLHSEMIGSHRFGGGDLAEQSFNAGFNIGVKTIGPTGESPHPDVEDDQGGLQAAIFPVLVGGQPCVKINFGVKLSFVVMTPGEAHAFGTSLVDHAGRLTGAIQS